MRVATVIGFIALGLTAGANAEPASPANAIEDFATYCGRGEALWKVSLCGPLILVDPSTQDAVASEDPGVPGFAKQGASWVGKLPPDVGIANTSVEIGGKRFAEIIMPLPDDATQRRILFSHESFHRIQPALGFHGHEGDNGHLDAKDGRIYARLEAAALKKALSSKGWRGAARDALSFRAARLALYPDAEGAETAMINNEGVAEYTGIRVGAAGQESRYAIDRLNSIAGRPSLIRSFGYVVGPAYGLLLDRTGNTWRQAALKGRPLPELLGEALSLPAARTIVGAGYGRAQIVAEETARDQKVQERRAALTAALVTGPTVTFPFTNVNYEFNPNSLFSLGDQGTVYGEATTVRDAWGTLKVSGNVLFSPSFSFARVPGPATISGQSLSGPGWTAELAPGYAIAPGPRAGQQVIKKP